MLSKILRGAFGAVALIASVLGTKPAHAAATDYMFQVEKTVPAGPGKTNVTLRLIHVPDQKPVEGAIVFEAKADMGPSGMDDMTARVTPQTSDQPGLYKFQTVTGMAGTWELILAAKVQGEAETIRGIVNFNAAE